MRVADECTHSAAAALAGLHAYRWRSGKPMGTGIGMRGPAGLTCPAAKKAAGVVSGCGIACITAQETRAPRKPQGRHTAWAQGA